MLNNLVLKEYKYWSEIRSNLMLMPILEIYNNSKERNIYDSLNRVRDYCAFDDIYKDEEVKPEYKEKIKGYYTGGGKNE